MHTDTLKHRSDAAVETPAKEDSDMIPYENLANAIVLQAVKDYRTALKRVARRPKDRDGLAAKNECERFFRSDWFGVLTEISPEMLIRKLQMEAQ
jgi:hypothetical protein